jgi:hypothetical protein
MLLSFLSPTSPGQLGSTEDYDGADDKVRLKEKPPIHRANLQFPGPPTASVT